VTDAMGRVTSYYYTDNNLVSAETVTSPDGSDQFATDYYAYDGAGNLIEHWTNNTSGQQIYTPSAATTGTWTFLTGTYNANAGTVTLYVNGGQSGGTAADTSPITAHGKLLVGADQVAGASADFLDGQVADVQVYPYTLSGAQVSSLYGLGQGGGDVTTGKLVTTWTRDERGLPTSMTDPDGAVTNYSYDEAGQLAVTTDPMVTTETYGGTPITARPVTMTGYDMFGDVSETEDADGNVATCGYDADGRQVSETLPPYTPPGGSPITAIDTMAYDGDVLATNTKTGKTRAEKVTAVLLHHDTNRYDLTVKTSHGSAVIETTTTHLFWDGTSHRWVKAAAPKYGDYLRTSDRATAAVLGGYVPADTSGWMWDLTVPGGDDHDFYIQTASTAVLVHNCPAPGGSSFPDLSGLRGADPEAVLGRIPDDWTVSSPARGEGVRFSNPSNPSQVIIYEEGSGDAADGLHGGPYLRVSTGLGPVECIPLNGNPVLGASP
jgi:YD repeat-containing protein